jgi:hypothetical protein
VSLLVWKIDPSRTSRSRPQLAGVHEIAVVRDGDLSVRAIDQDGLRVEQAALARGRVAGVADRDMAGQRFERRLVERLGHVAHGARDPHLLAIGGADAGALLAAVLQRVEPEVGQVGRFGMPEDAKNTTLVFEFIQLLARFARWRSGDT